MTDYTGSTYISASRQDSNAVPTANPPFSGSSNSAALLRILPDVTGSRILKMAAAILKSRLPVTSDSIRNSAAELLDPENWGGGWLAVGTALLTCLEAEI